MTSTNSIRAFLLLVIIVLLCLFRIHMVDGLLHSGETTISAMDSCSSNPCLRGTCFANGTDYHCFCPSGVTGKNCESILDVCSSNPCVRGTCLQYQTQYYCACPLGYTGHNCESITNACDANPCLRGVCFHNKAQFHCICPQGYTGKKCEINNNECTSQPCFNGGICLDDVANFSCTCPPGFNGSLCETDVDECSTKPCLNGGVCIDGINRFECHCKTGFSGDICQNVTDPCKYNPCVRGTCFSHSSQFICECPPDYTGKVCDNDLTLTLNGPREVYLKIPAGSELYLNCSVSTSSMYGTSFQWSKVRKCWSSSGGQRSVYQITNVDAGDSGIYNCTATYQQIKVQKFFHVEITWQSEVCHFDDRDICGWTKDNYWHLQDGSQPNSGIEQYNDHTLGIEKGMYLQAPTSSQRYSDQVASLTSHTLEANHTICFEFWYRVSGNGLGKLSMLLKDTCIHTQTKVLEFVGDHGRKWNKASATIQKHYIPNDYQIILQADIRRTFHGDMAVDDLLISDGHCQDSRRQGSIYYYILTLYNCSFTICILLLVQLYVSFYLIAYP